MVNIAGFFPLEIWYQVWLHLTFSERVRTSQVCRYWRASALAFPALWTGIHFWTFQHHQSCICHECEDPSARRRRLGTNLTVAVDRLRRTGRFPVLLSISVKAQWANPAPLHALGSHIVDLHNSSALRVVSIVIEFEDPNVLHHLFRHIPVLKHVNRLVTRYTGSGDYLESDADDFDDLQIPGASVSTCLPDLQHLGYSSGLRWIGRTQLATPKIQTLTCGIRSVREFAHICRLFQSIQTLTLSIDDDKKLNFAVNGEIKAVLDRIPNVHITRVSRAAEAWVEHAWFSPSRAVLHLSYKGVAPVSGIKVFYGLQVVGLYIIRFKDDFIRVTCLDDKQKKRIITCPVVRSEDLLLQVLAGVRLEALRSIRISDSIYGLFLYVIDKLSGPTNVPAFPKLGLLTVLISLSFDAPAFVDGVRRHLSTLGTQVTAEFAPLTVDDIR